MQLKFKTTGSTAAFVKWLKGFKDINNSLLIEVNLDSESFISKSFTDKKSIVKYSSISFADAGYEFFGVYDGDNKLDWEAIVDKETDGRIKFGLFELLNKVIDVVNMYAETDHSLDIEFDLANSVFYKGMKTSEKAYQGTALHFASLSLSMNIKGAPLSDTFVKLDDETFLNRVCNIGSPSTYEVTSDTLSNLYKISSILSNDTEAKIKFYSKVVDGQRALYAYDISNNSYDYLLGYYSEGEDGDTATIVHKATFISATKGITADTLKFTLDTAGASRVLIDSEDSKIIIAAARD